MIDSARALLDQPARVHEYTWTERDFLLYAVSLGLGRCAVGEDGLSFVYERDLRVVPTFPTVIAWVTPPTFPSLGIDAVHALHGEQRIEIHRPVRGPLSVCVSATVIRVRGKGVARGAAITLRQIISDLADGERVATLTTTCFGRREGGCGDAGPDAVPTAPAPTTPPERTYTMETLSDAALLYRLTGDDNPLHVDPTVARAAGFPRPILHGLCGFGMTCRAVLMAYPDLHPCMVASHEARFSAPIYPSETLAVDLWRKDECIWFRARVIERDVVAIANGLCQLRRTQPSPN